LKNAGQFCRFHDALAHQRPVVLAEEEESCFRNAIAYSTEDNGQISQYQYCLWQSVRSRLPSIFNEKLSGPEKRKGEVNKTNINQV
jgi:hypothetical protein